MTSWAKPLTLFIRTIQFDREVKVLRQTLVWTCLIVTAVAGYAIANTGPAPAPEDCTTSPAGCQQRRINDLAHVAQWITTTHYIKMPVSVTMCNPTNPASSDYRSVEFKANDDSFRSYTSCPVSDANYLCQAAGFASAHGLSDDKSAVLVAGDEIVCIARPALGLHR